MTDTGSAVLAGEGLVRQRLQVLGNVAAGDKHALWPLHGRTLCMQPGAEESRLSFDFVAGQGKSQEQLFRGEIMSNCIILHLDMQTWKSRRGIGMAQGLEQQIPLASTASRDAASVLCFLQLWVGQ